MSAIIGIDRSELLLWAILRNFESLALRQYELYVPTLAGEEKRALVALLSSQVPSDEVLDEAELAVPVNDLVAGATGSDAVHTLIVQGLLLELLGQTIYQSFGQSELVSSSTRTLCADGLAASQTISKKIPALIAEEIGTGESLFQTLMIVSRPVLRQLDTLGVGLDQHFSARFGICFADLMGEFAADFIPACTELGLDRRKLVGFLTGALMGV
jgi:hypothetical protein